ncbi:hypothetical protein BDY24DRAFT_439098 [Mrakia frigida]|uniref:uncharacterized protein n=1 Tax=Mrakia frigida TaxID=29902 RepID=UPI003FCBEE33
MYKTIKPTIISRGARFFSTSRLRFAHDTGNTEAWKEAQERTNKLTGVANPGSAGKLANSVAKGVKNRVDLPGKELEVENETVGIDNPLAKVEVRPASEPPSPEPKERVDGNGKIIGRKEE